MFNRQHIKKAHFIGIGGIGVSAIARLLASRGTAISGSDIALPPRATLPPGDFTEGHKKEHVPPDADFVVYSAAAPETNPERVAAQELGIPAHSYPEALAEITKPYHTIAVSGTHGKSTTTALAGLFFEAGGLDPSVIVGAEVPGWKERNLRIGKGDTFIVEACEYRRHMLLLQPQAILLTNLELDHPDYYRDIDDVIDAFRAYVAKLSGNGLLVYNNDDALLRKIADESDAIKVSYGIGEGPDLFARSIHTTEMGQTFELVWKGMPLGEFFTPLYGLYNIYNILGAAAVYLTYGGDIAFARDALLRFKGVGRRFEILGNTGNAVVVSDYAHHPTALTAVTRAAKDAFPGKEILVVFRPHHRERTIKLFDQFVASLASIDHALLVEIYDVAGREEDAAISSRDLITTLLSAHPRADIAYASGLDEAEAIVRKKSSEFDVILVVGAGDADQLARKLVATAHDISHHTYETAALGIR